MSERTARIVEGPLGREMLRFGTPLAVGMGLQTTFNLVDAWLVSRIDAELVGPSLGAIGICDQIAAIGTIVSYGVSTATAAIVAQRAGCGDREGVRRVAWQSMLVVGALSLAFGLLGGLAPRFVLRDVVGAKGQVAELGASYLQVMLAGSFSIFFLLQVTAIQRALGSAKTPASLLVLSNVLNLFLAVLLVYGPGPAPAPLAWGPPLARALGVPRLQLLGAAWATVIARTLALVPLLVVTSRRFELFGRGSRRSPDRRTLGELLSIAWPSSAQLVVRIAAMLLTHAIVARAFTTERDQSATTALGVVFRLETMALFVALGWGSAAQTFVGQALGAGRPSRASRAGWMAAGYAALLMAAIAAAYRLEGAAIVAFFDSDPVVGRMATSYLDQVGPSYVGLGLGIVLGSAMTGAGATRTTLAVDLVVTLLVQIPVEMAAIAIAGASPERLWSAVGAVYVTSGVAYTFVYRRGRFLMPRSLGIGRGSGGADAIRGRT